MTTAEIRWFFAEVISWEALKQSLFFSPPSERVDYYLLGTGEQLGVKWREGSIEAKQQQGNGETYHHGRLTGELEFWKKWSFALDRKESYHDALAAQPQHWLAIRKQRQMTGFAYDARQQAVYPQPPDTSADEGCDLEITYLSVAEKTYATLGLEAYGREDVLRQNIMSTIGYLSENGNLEGLDLSLAYSNNYARWIHTTFRHTNS